MKLRNAHICVLSCALQARPKWAWEWLANNYAD